jgi:hypothetical protein
LDRDARVHFASISSIWYGRGESAETSIFPGKMDEKCLQNGSWKMDVGPRAPGVHFPWENGRKMPAKLDVGKWTSVLALPEKWT